MTDDLPSKSIVAALLPPLVMLRAFEAAGRTGSMRRAAEDIGVSHTVVSRHVRNLEHGMGRKLVKTGPRGVELTVEGESLLSSVSKAFAIIANASNELRSVRSPGRLRIWCIPCLATRWFTPRLSLLEQTMGGIDIELRATETKPDLLKGEADIFIGFGVTDRLPDGAVEIVRPRMFPVVRNDWLEAHGTPRDINALATFPLLHESNRLQWTAWFSELKVPIDQPLAGPRLSDASISFDAALAGQGIALVNELMASDDLRKGHVIELFDTNVELGTYYLLTSARKSSDPTILAFRRWLLGAIAA